MFYEYDFVSIYNDNLFETRVVNSGNNNSHMLGPIWKFLFSEHPLYSTVFTHERRQIPKKWREVWKMRAREFS